MKQNNNFSQALAPYKQDIYNALIKKSDPAAGVIATEQSSYILPDGVIVNFGWEQHDIGQGAAVDVLPKDIQDKFFNYDLDYEKYIENAASIVETALPGAIRLNSAQDNTYCLASYPLTAAQKQTLLNGLDLLQAKGFKELEITIDPVDGQSSYQYVSLVKNTADEIVKAINTWLATGKVKYGMLETVQVNEFSDALIEEYE